MRAESSLFSDHSSEPDPAQSQQTVDVHGRREKNQQRVHLPLIPSSSSSKLGQNKALPIRKQDRDGGAANKTEKKELG